jgi:hypothetical protein
VVLRAVLGLMVPMLLALQVAFIIYQVGDGDDDDDDDDDEEREEDAGIKIMMIPHHHRAEDPPYLAGPDGAHAVGAASRLHHLPGGWC